jgi:hypothetical protein
MTQVIYSKNQGFQNNYNYIGDFDDEYYDNHYDFDCDEPQYEYTDASGRPYLDTAIPPPSIFYVMDKVKQRHRIARQLEKEKKQKEDILAARRAADEARWQDQEVKYRNEQQCLALHDFFRRELNKLTLAEIGKAIREKTFTDEIEVKIANEVFMSKLPRFPASTLERMKKEEAEKSEPKADRKFYTWLAGNSASSTSRTAWGSSRTSGKNQKKADLQVMNSDAYIQRAAARRARRKRNTEKEAEEQVKRTQTIARINSQIAARAAEAEVEVVAKAPDEETEYQKFKREELEAFRVKIATTEYKEDLACEIATENTTTEPTWTKVVTSKKNKLATQIEQALYATPVCLSAEIAEAVAPKPMSKKVTATIMCRSVAQNQKCPYPPGKCNFAHSVEELNPRQCINRFCKFVKNIGGKYVNNGKKVCAYLHEGETKSNLCNRIGVRVQEVICKPVIVLEKINTLKLTPMGTRVLKPYSATQAWGPIV